MSRRDATSIRVLVVGDAADTADVCRLLAAEFGRVEASGAPEPGRADHADVERVAPHVVVLAFRQLAEAQERLALLRRATGPGTGSYRAVVLCARDDAAAAFALCTQDVFDDYVPHWPQPEDVHRLSMAVRAAGRDAVDAAEPSLVMVVEDDEVATELIAVALEPQPWRLMFASDARQAIGMLREQRPDVILMDVNLPGMDGLQLTERLKSMPSYADIPILMLTGEARRETLQRSHHAGAVGFIVKPFTPDGLVARLRPFLS